MTPSRWLRSIGLGLIGLGVGYAAARTRRRRAARAMPIGGQMIMDVGIVDVDPEPMADDHAIPYLEEAPCSDAHAKS